MLQSPFLDISDEVKQALAHGVAVVALESTIISHGMPYPQNVATAHQVEAQVRAHGAVPATIAIVNGRLKAGLSAADIEQLGRQGREVVKVSRRDIPFVVAAGKTGATTVASTMIISAMAGIKVFATGGIGGVHRNAQHTFDISADLQELAQTPVAVVCAGAKSILDLKLTLEYLETQGVPVVGSTALSTKLSVPSVRVTPELRSLTRTLALPAAVLFDGVLGSSPGFANYALIDGADLHAQVAFTRLQQIANVEVRSMVSGQAFRTRLPGSLADGGECYVSSAGELHFYPSYPPQAGEQVVAYLVLDGPVDVAGRAEGAEGRRQERQRPDDGHGHHRDRPDRLIVTEQRHHHAGVQA